MRGGLQELKLLGLLGRVLRELEQGGASVDGMKLLLVVWPTMSE